MFCYSGPAKVWYDGAMDIQQLIITIGYLGLFVVIFSESGLLFGVVFPGDSLLFTAGFLASQGVFNIAVLVVVCFLAAVLGDSVGYAFGRRVGKRFFTRDEGIFFRRDNVERARSFFERHGGKTIILARFVPGVRTLAPIIAGVGDMGYQVFLAYNVVGGLLWAVGVTLLGYFLGSAVPGADRYLLPIVMVVVIVSILPAVYELLRSRERRQSVRQWFSKLGRR